MSTAIELLPYEKRQVWEQQPDEGELDHARFTSYLELPRSQRTFKQLALTRATAGDEVSENALRQRSYQKGWRERVAAYDRHIDALALQSLVDRRVESLTAIADLGKALREKAAQALVLLKESNAKLSPYDIVQLARFGTELEQLALGAPTDRITLQTASTDSTMTETEAAGARSALQSAIEKIRQRRTEAQARSPEEIQRLAEENQLDDVDFEVIVEDTDPSPEEIRQERVALNGAKTNAIRRKY